MEPESRRGWERGNMFGAKEGTAHKIKLLRVDVAVRTGIGKAAVEGAFGEGGIVLQNSANLWIFEQILHSLVFWRVCLFECHEFFNPPFS
jgi:hypothetical protein